MLPALFLSHGAPLLPLTDAPARRFLEALPDALPARPRAILIASAHWETPSPAVSSIAGPNRTIHDFQGFPEPLYRLRYPAPGDPVLAAQVLELLRRAGFKAAADNAQGLDHGAWVPLLLAWPDATIPVLQVSVQPHLGPVHHVALGRALAPLRTENVLVIGSGSFTHNLRATAPYGTDSDGALPSPDWVTSFCNWMDAALAEGREDDLVAYRERAPFAARNHPSEEHLLPLFVALGAGGRARRLHRSQTYGVLRMDAYAFG